MSQLLHERGTRLLVQRIAAGPRRPPSATFSGIRVTAAPALRRDQANMAPAHKASATLPRFSAHTAVPGHAFS